MGSSIADVVTSRARVIIAGFILVVNAWLLAEVGLLSLNAGKPHHLIWIGWSYSVSSRPFLHERFFLCRRVSFLLPKSVNLIFSHWPCFSVPCLTPSPTVIDPYSRFWALYPLISLSIGPRCALLGTKSHNDDADAAVTQGCILLQSILVGLTKVYCSNTLT